MGRVNLYIRVEDEEKFESIKDRSEWLHRSIQGEPLDTTALDAIEAKIDYAIALINDIPDTYPYYTGELAEPLLPLKEPQR